jgi:fatty acid desaturase
VQGSAEWYHTEVARKDLKELMKRSDGPAIRDTIIWLGLMVVFAALAIWLWPSWWAALPLAAYGVLYGSATDSRWHECSHGTAFKTPWMNDVVYHIACFMIMRNPTRWRWSHTRHHTDTLIVGPRSRNRRHAPAGAVQGDPAFFGILDVWHAMKTWCERLRRDLGRRKTFIPEMEWPKVILAARIWFVIYAATIATAFFLNSMAAADACLWACRASTVPGTMC